MEDEELKTQISELTSLVKQLLLENQKLKTELEELKIQHVVVGPTTLPTGYDESPIHHTLQRIEQFKAEQELRKKEKISKALDTAANFAIEHFRKKPIL